MALQREAFRLDPPALEGRELAEYLRWNVLAATDELHETLDCFNWKPWTVHDGRPVVHSRDKAVDELVDVLHFVANILAALDVNGDELSGAYHLAWQKNRRRQEAGDDGTDKTRRRTG